MKFTTAVNTIRERLEDHVPKRLSIDSFIPAAVTIPIFEKNGKPHMLLTLRADTVEHHKGQVSFPGGAWEPHDTSIEQTALRETDEEVGIPPSMTRVIGQLDDFPTISDFIITPFVTTIPYPFPTDVNPDEVAKLLEVPFDLFLTDSHFEAKIKRYKNTEYPVYYYYFEDTIIWGITGFIINRFVEMTFGYNPAPQSISADPRIPDYLRDNVIKLGIRNQESKRTENHKESKKTS
ncbi:MAG: CoA pyrophosphatase [Calditrichia bacterium]